MILRTVITAFVMFISFEGFALDVELKVGALNRGASLYYPIQSRALYPTIIALHGGGGNRTELLEDALIDRYTRGRGFLLVAAEGIGPTYPSGKVAGSWNAGRCCGPAQEENVDDVGYLRALIQLLVSKHRADPKRIFLMGFSNGGKMAYRAACELADQIAGIGTIGAIGVFDSKPGAHDNCPLVKPVPTIHIHGSEDRCSPEAGGDVGNCFNTFISLLTGKPVEDPYSVHVSLEPGPEFFDKWTKRMGFIHSHKLLGRPCIGYSRTLLSPVRSAYCSLPGVGHVIPGGRYGAPCALGPYSKMCLAWKQVVAGTKDGDLVPFQLFDASQQLVDFFSQLP